MPNNNKVGAALVVGAGVGGMQAALDLAESGIKAYLVDTSPSIGGVMSQLDKTFPTNDCAMCTMAPRLVQIGRHKNIEIITLADVQSIVGQPGNLTVTINKKPRFVDEDKCTGCGTCVTNCPVRNQIYILPEEKVKIELEPEDLEKANKIIKEYRDQEGTLVPLLQEISSIYNYLPENVLRYISQELDIPLASIYRMATFYRAFSLKPVGKHIITACLGTTCHVKGQRRNLDTLQRELGIHIGETTEDMNFTLETAICLGCCGLAPVMRIDDTIYSNLTPAKLLKIIEEYKIEVS